MLTQLTQEQRDRLKDLTFEDIIWRLQNTATYYKWIPLNARHTLWLRIPKTDPAELWLENEDIKVIHICDKKKFIEAVKANDIVAQTMVCNYVYDYKCLSCGIKTGYEGGKSRVLTST